VSGEPGDRRPTLATLEFELLAEHPAGDHWIALGRVERGDFFADPLPKADVITMGLILHDWNLENKKHLVKAAYDALPEGGAFIAIENIIDDARRENASGC
jgi:flavin reductase (DIM6/NTAB) family NADH-FMN oxidoreductase RutF